MGENNKIMSIADNIKKLRETYDLTQSQLGKIAGVSDKAVWTWENGTAEPRMGALQKIADHFGITKSELVADYSENNQQNNFKLNRIPVLGSVPAGVPIEAIEDVVDWEDIPMEWLNGGKEYFGLKVKGDSMYPKYLENDTLIVRKEDDCESGQDCVVYVNVYDATLKKVIKRPDCIILQPLNPAYEPKIYDYNDEDNLVKIAGIVVEIRRTV